MTAPDEPALRREDWREGEPIELSDGQTWHFPRPVMRDFYPAMQGGKLALVPGSDLGPGYDGLVDAFLEADTFGGEHLALTALAYELLRRNYRVEYPDLRYLLRIERADDGQSEENRAMWGRIAAVALGRTEAKKPSPVGSAP
jgi:hypothetical protein